MGNKSSSTFKLVDKCLMKSTINNPLFKRNEKLECVHASVHVYPGETPLIGDGHLQSDLRGSNWTLETSN